jgi:HPt (histidine-containing phosphotransfer) domain-containing protein
MGHHAEILRQYLGKEVRDIYGRNVGNIIGLTMDEKGALNSIGIEHSTGDFAQYTTSHLKIDGETIVLVPVWKVDAENLQKEIAIGQKRLQALDQLLREKRISEYTYEDLRRGYESAMRQLEELRRALVDKLKQRRGELEHQGRRLEEFIANVEVQFMTGEIDEEAHRMATSSLQVGLERMIQEKTDIETILKAISPPDISQAPEAHGPAEIGDKPPIILDMR